MSEEQQQQQRRLLFFLSEKGGEKSCNLGADEEGIFSSSSWKKDFFVADWPAPPAATEICRTIYGIESILEGGCCSPLTSVYLQFRLEEIQISKGFCIFPVGFLIFIQCFVYWCTVHLARVLSFTPYLLLFDAFVVHWKNSPCSCWHNSPLTLFTSHYSVRLAAHCDKKPLTTIFNDFNVKLFVRLQNWRHFIPNGHWCRNINYFSLPF